MEHIREFHPDASTGRKQPETTRDETALIAYPDVKKINHVHHGGNSSGVVDGASAVLVTSPAYAKAHGMKPKARIIR